MTPELEYLNGILAGLVDHPDDVEIRQTADEMGTLLSVRVHKNDMGNIIGRDGVTAKAIRTLIRHHGKRNGKTIAVKIE